MTDMSGSERWRSYVICYALYALFLVCCLLAFVVWRTTLLMFLGAALGESDALRSLYLGGIILMGLGMMILALAGESYLREGLRRQQLSRRFMRLMAPLGGAIVLGLLLQFLFAAVT